MARGVQHPFGMNTATADTAALAATYRARFAGYEGSPACLLLATHCACCGRALVDAKSVETGVGPECRKRHGYATAEGSPDWVVVFGALAAAAEADARLGEVACKVVDLIDDARKAANLVMHRIAAAQTGAGVGHLVVALRALGFRKMAERTADRLGSVLVEVDAATGVLAVFAPYSEEFTAEMRKVPGRWFDREAKANKVPASSRSQLWGALRAALRPGTLVVGPTRVTVI